MIHFLNQCVLRASGKFYKGQLLYPFAQFFRIEVASFVEEVVMQVYDFDTDMNAFYLCPEHIVITKFKRLSNEMDILR